MKREKLYACIAVCWLTCLPGGCTPNRQSQQEKLLKDHYRTIATNMSTDLRKLKHKLYTADAQEAKKILEELPDAEFVVFALQGDMDGSVFSSFIGTKAFDERILALNDDDFANLMILRKGWHSGTALMALVHLGEGDAYEGKEPVLIRKFWERIKRLSRDKIVAVLNANYCGATLWDWLKDHPHVKRGLPQDIENEMRAFLR